ncbi:MAG: ankyrin repeat domain-containing protein [Phycisphaerae bacterium]|nr:ankyrin repeat domain-containing protein [Phycisphaerae bacterium]
MRLSVPRVFGLIVLGVFILFAGYLWHYNRTLHVAVRRGDLDRVRDLVESGADVNQQDEWGITALHEAGYYGHVDLVRYLVGRAASPHLRDHRGSTALHWAMGRVRRESIGDKRYIMEDALFKRKLEAVAILISAGADINAKDGSGETPLHDVAGIPRELGHRSDLEMIGLLLEKGADINAKNDEGCTPLHLAVYAGRTDLVRLLVERGASVDAKNNGGKTALEAAIKSKHDAIVSLLRQRSGESR